MKNEALIAAQKAFEIEAAEIVRAKEVMDWDVFAKAVEALAKAESSDGIKANFKITKIFPWFILGFLAMVIVASVFSIPTEIVGLTKSTSKFLMVCALAAIGLNTSLSDMKKSGIRPMIHGFIISALVVIVALLVEICMGIV